MAACSTCNICDQPGTLSTSRERLLVPCNVRAFKDNVFTVWRCASCGSLHSAEDADLNRYYSEYPPHRFDASKLDFITRLSCRNRLRLLMRCGLRRSQHVLDYGCGGGMFLRYLAEQGFSHVTGYDAFVREFSDATVLEDRYDAVVTWDVIEHMEEPREFFRSLVRLLRPGGLLAIGTPNAEHISLNKPPLSTPELHQPYHRHILSESALLSLGKENHMITVERYHRLYMDTPFPFINTQFMWGYTVASGGYIDVVGAVPKLSLFFRHPSLLTKAFFGYWFPSRANMIIVFRAAAA